MATLFLLISIILCGIRNVYALIIDVTPLSLGIEGYGGITRRLIEKNSEYPTKQSIKLKGNQLPQVDTMNNNGISGIVIKIIQGERVNITDNIILGEYILNGKYDETIDVEVIFEINATSIFKVVTMDDINGKNEITFTPDEVRPHQHQIDAMLHDAEEHKEADKKYGEWITARNELAQTILDLAVTLSDDALIDKMTEDDMEILLSEVEIINNWIDNNGDAGALQLNEKRLEFITVVRNILGIDFKNDVIWDETEDIDYIVGHDEL